MSDTQRSCHRHEHPGGRGPRTPVDLSDSRSYVAGVPHAWLAHLRRHDPVHWQDEPGGPGFWAVTRYEDCVTVNRDYERFSSAAQGTMPFELGEEDVAQQSLMMLNMDPPLHTRYRRLVNKGFTPRMVRDLEASIHRSTDAIIDEVIETGEADFVTQLSAELPLQVIAELLGVPQDDRHRMFDWSNRMVGNEDPEYQAAGRPWPSTPPWSSTPTPPSSSPRSASTPTPTS